MSINRTLPPGYNSRNFRDTQDHQTFNKRGDPNVTTVAGLGGRITRIGRGFNDYTVDGYNKFNQNPNNPITNGSISSQIISVQQQAGTPSKPPNNNSN